MTDNPDAEPVLPCAAAKTAIVVYSRIDSLILLPVGGGCHMKMLPVWDGRDGRQQDEAAECGKQARGDGGGSGALSG